MSRDSRRVRGLWPGLTVAAVVTGVAGRRGAGLAAVARAGAARRLDRGAAADDMERHREPGVAGAARRRRRVVADRRRRSRDRHLAGRPGAGRGRRSSRCSRATIDRWPDVRPPIGGAGGPGAGRRPALVVEAFDRVSRPAAVGAPHGGRRAVPRGAREAQPGDAEAGHRRRAGLRLVRQRPGRGARPGRTAAGLAAASRHGERAVRRSLGPRQLAGAARRSGHPAVRSRPTSYLLALDARTGTRALEGRRAAAGASRTARRW